MHKNKYHRILASIISPLVPYTVTARQVTDYEAYLLGSHNLNARGLFI